MSDQTKKAADSTQRNLEAAQVYVKEAEKQAQITGDKQLIQKVSKIGKDISETSGEIKQKLGEGR